MILSFVVAGTPVPCSRARIATGRVRNRAAGVFTYTPKRTTDYKALVSSCAVAAVLKTPGWKYAEDRFARFRVSLVVWRAADRGDWDNYAKSVTDACKGIVWLDDRLIRIGHVELEIDRVHPRVEVVIEALAPVEAPRRKR